VLEGLLLAVLVLVAGFGQRHVGTAALIVLSVVWLWVNRAMEGHILLPVTPDHGLTAADLAGFAGLALAAVRFRTLYE
jgi:hypothetical protein